MRVLIALIVGAALGSLWTADSRPQVEARRSWSCEVDGELVAVQIGGRWLEAVCYVPPETRLGRVVVSVGTARVR